MSNVDGNPVANDAKELVALCRAGRLYKVEEWIADGRPLDISRAIKRGRQRSLLEIAVEIGFHSLVELIAKHETSQSAKDTALGDAVSSRRLISSNCFWPMVPISRLSRLQTCCSPGNQD